MLSSAFFFGVQIGLYALFGLLLKGIIIDKSIQFFNENKEIVIISDQSEEIKQFIVGDLEKGATLHSAKGAFSDDKKEVITTILGRKDFSRLKSYIQSTDNKAFITVHRMNEIWGHNFKSAASERDFDNVKIVAITLLKMLCAFLLNNCAGYPINCCTFIVNCAV